MSKSLWRYNNWYYYKPARTDAHCGKDIIHKIGSKKYAYIINLDYENSKKFHAKNMRDAIDKVELLKRL